MGASADNFGAQLHDCSTLMELHVAASACINKHIVPGDDLELVEDTLAEDVARCGGQHPLAVQGYSWCTRLWSELFTEYQDAARSSRCIFC